MISLLDRIVDIKNRRNRAAYFLAVLDGHGAVVALDHDLQRQTVLTRQTHAHEPEARGAQHRRNDAPPRAPQRRFRG